MLAVSSSLLWAGSRDPDPARLRRAGEAVRQLLFGKAVVREAERHLGKPYAWGDKQGRRGFDCSGYTSYVFKTLGLDIPTDALSQYQKGIAVERPALQEGDLVFFLSDSPGAMLHVGIYAGQDQFLHAPGKGKFVQRSSMKQGYFARRYVGARRYLPATWEPKP